MTDLHLHLDGSLSAKTVLALAKKQGITLPANTAAALHPYLTAPQDCDSLNTYLKCFDLPLSLLQTGYALEYAADALLQDLEADGVTQAEIRFAPQLHTRLGMSLHEIIESVLCGIQGKPCKANLILCCMRGDINEEENIATVRAAADFLGRGVCALDLAGAEGLYKTKTFSPVFSLARELKLPFTIHAGEADGADSIRAALEFGAKRIGHGIRVAEDVSLLREVIENRIPLEMCPTSNVQTKAVKTITEHPIAALLRQGACVTVNTDNRTVSDTTLTKEFALVQEAFSLSDTEIKALHENARQAVFAI